MYKLAKEVKLIENNTIKFFFKEFFFLSNFYVSPMIIDGIIYKTNEHYFQSMKAIDKKQRDEIINAKTASLAKKLGRKCILKSDWNYIKNHIMLKGVFTKFSQNEKLKERLLNTNDLILQEGNDWNDKYWGVDWITGEGENKLGKILMIVRSKLKLENCKEKKCLN